jgi:hypothetical protein
MNPAGIQRAGHPPCKPWFQILVQDHPLVELVEALRELRRLYNQRWLIERHGDRTLRRNRADRSAGVGARISA